MQHGSDNRRWCGSVTDWARYWQPQDEENIRFAIPETVAVLRPSASAMRVAAADCDMCKVPVRPVSSALLVCVARTFDSPTRDCLRRARLHFIVRKRSTSPLDQDRRGAPCGLSENVKMRPCGMRLFEDYMFIPAQYEGWIGSGYVSTIVCAASPSEAIQALQADDRDRVTASGVKGVQYGCRTGAPTESQRGRPRGTQQSLRQVVVTHRVSLSAQWVRARRRGRTPSLPHSSRTRNNTTELDMQRYL